MQIHPSDPLAIAHGYKPHGGRLGMGPFAGYTDFAIDRAEDGEILFYWTLETYGSAEGIRSHIFKNGVYLATVGGDQWAYAPGADETRWKFDFLLAPNLERFVNYRHFWPENLYNRVSLSWSLPAGPVTKIHVYKNDDHDNELNTSTPYKRLLTTTPRISGTSKAEVSGKWFGIERTATINFTVTLSGDPADEAGEVAWTWGTVTGTLTPKSVYQLITNGIKIKFTEALVFGETFSVVVGFPTTTTTNALANGTHLFAIGTFNGTLEKIAPEISMSVVTMPKGPVYDSYAYTDGTGSVDVWFRMPADPDIKTARVYRNWPGYWEVLGWRSVEQFTVTPGQLKKITVTDLREGLNRIAVRVWNSGSHEENLSYFEITLDAALNEIATPYPPSYVDATLDTDGQGVIFATEADASSDTINFYSNGGSGAIDYTTPVATATNPATLTSNAIEALPVYLADGTYEIAARAEFNGTEEKNTTVTATITIDRRFPPTATGLAGVVL